MEAVAWSALWLFAATVIAAIFWLGTRIDGLGATLNARIDGLGAALNARIDGLAARIDGLDARIDGLDARIDGLDARIGTQTGELSQLSRRLEEHLGRHAG
jgi:ABC-type transporter Mla subunit MlaD